jgi:mono/diheme cytochrome c family protein
MTGIRPTFSAKAALVLVMLAGFAVSGCHRNTVQDEAMQAGVPDSHFKQADEDYFKAMDNGVQLSPEEIRGRNMWNVWTAGDDRFWDTMTKPTFGGFDLLKIVAGRPGTPHGRDQRWQYLGLINEPCFTAAQGPDPKHFGLYIDQRDGNCPPDPFANEAKYPGVKIGARGTKFDDGTVLPVGSYYGEPSGIVGLRLFPNPDFDAKAKAHWDPVRYYNDPGYYNDAKLIRPYRVGMSCGFCHIGPSPTHPPADPAHPAWENLNSTVGAQYMWVDRLFMVEANPKNFMYQLVRTFRPGAMDTSLVSTDNINNPRTMNAIYNLPERLDNAAHVGRETLAAGEHDNKQFNDFVKTGPLTRFYTAPDTVYAPHVLKDGSDSVGALGALNRVYLNIGLFSEDWLRHFNAVVGGKPISPMTIANANANSAYWRATENGTPDMARFFLKAGRPDYLATAPGGGAYLTASPETLARGRDVFADTCARCHSSKGPVPDASMSLAGGGPEYLGRFKKWWAWTQTPAYKTQMRAIVEAPDFLTGNYLSMEARIPATLLRTNACSPLASNAIGGNIWNDFSASSYKSLPSVGSITIRDPFTGAPSAYAMAAGGRGYTRPPTLVSVWASAPYLLNNSVGPFNQDPSVKGRMAMFDAGIRQMLWPETRDGDAVLGKTVDGTIDRTTARSWILIPRGFVPEFIARHDAAAQKAAPTLIDKNGDIHLGPIPEGIPVNLLSNLQPLAETKSPAAVAKHYDELIDLLVRINIDLAKAPKNATDADLRAHFANLAGPMLKLSKCPDFVVNRGHYFGTAKFNDQDGLTADERSFGKEPVLADADKLALIEYLKTL